MTHQERVAAALNHETPDRVPMDLGATRVTSVVAVGDDVGMQRAPMVSPKMYRELIWPLQKRQFSFLRERTKAKISRSRNHEIGVSWPRIRRCIEPA